MKKMQLHCRLVAISHNGEEIEVAVYKAGRTVELRFDHPISGRSISRLVHPLNAGTVEGWIHEIGVQCGPDMSIVNWQWKD